MKYFTVGIICMVLGLFISSLKEAEMKSLDRVDIQDGKVRTIKDPITGLKDEQERGMAVSHCADHFAGWGKCDTNRCGDKYYATTVMRRCCGACKVNCRGSIINDSWCQTNCSGDFCPGCNDLSQKPPKCRELCLCN